MPHHKVPDESGTNTMNNRGSRRGRGQGRNTGKQKNNRFKLKQQQVYQQNQQLLENVFTNQY